MAARPAKISRPVLHEPFARERLFGLLDELRAHPVVWIAAPPGTGKTTLVASWLEKQQHRAIWYQIDPTDNDPATFFYFLGVAAQAVQRKAEPLPLLTSELTQDLPSFARRYLRALFARLDPAAIVVLDNVHELSHDSPLYLALSKAAEEIPSGTQLIFISRCGSAGPFARLKANKVLRCLSAEDLKFTLLETKAMARRLGGISPDEAQALHQLCDGWPAGLSLLMDRKRRGEPLKAAADNHSLEDVFNYFATEIVEQLSQSEQHTLLKLAGLPYLTPEIARRTSGDDSAGELIDYLYRHNLFLDRRTLSVPDAEDCYQLHSLFQSFLRSKAGCTLSTKVLRATAGTGARLLQERGDVEGAFGLYLEACDWDAAASLVLSHAEQLLQQGRRQLLLEWIAHLPTERVEADPWLLHWSGLAQVGVEPRAGREALERAYMHASSLGDDVCRALTVAGIIESLFLEYADLSALKAWIPILEELIPRVGPADANAKLRCYAGLVGAIFHCQGNPPVLATYVAHTVRLFRDADNANLKVAAATHLLRYGTHLGDMAIARQALTLVRPILRDPLVTPLRKGLCQLFVVWFYVNVPQERQAREAIASLQRLAEENGLRELHRFVAATAYWLEMTHQHRAEAARWISLLEEEMNPAHAYDVACMHLLRAWSLTVEGDLQVGLRAAHESVAVFDRAGWTWHRILARGVLSWVYAEMKDFDNARHWSRQGRALADETDIHVLDVQFDQVEALACLACGEDAQPVIKRLFSAASQYGNGFPLRFFPTVIPRLCALALQCDTEAAYVRSLIRNWEWCPEDVASESWPWPVRIYLLGAFGLYVKGERVKFSARAPHKVLSLLKALICFGANNVRDRRLIDALWPEDEADAAKAAFSIALHRLRKLLEQSEAIEVKDGALSLNTTVCWVDAIAFDHLLQRSHSPGQAEPALALYRGNLLPEDDDQPWSNYLREALRRKFLHQVEWVGEELEKAGQWQRAMDHYQRALDADNLAEPFYRGLMRCLNALDRGSEAISVYRRMEHLFSITLGLQPTAESRVLYRSFFSKPVAVPDRRATGARQSHGGRRE